MPASEFSVNNYREAAQFIRGRARHQPEIAVILGSGLGDFVSALEDSTIIPFKEVPGYVHSQVIGHSNRLVIGTLEGKPLLVQQGRVHFYEGWTMGQVAFPIRVMHELGVKTLVITNAAGGLNKGYEAGDLMLIHDHINLLGMTGQNPLMGPNEDHYGERFPAMNTAYDRELRVLTRKVAAERGLTLREGVYVGLSGPAFETPAEIKMLRIMGADAVGMSTVNEVVVARHCGMRVLGFSGISNICIDDPDADLEATHQEVLDVGTQKIVPGLISLLRGVIAAL